MENEVNTRIECTNCGESLPDDWIRSENKGVCPRCGSNQKTIHIGIVEKAALNFRESLTGKLKDKNFNSKKNPRYEFFEGDDVRKLDDKWMKKSRIIDKYSDKCYEKVTDPESGDIVHHCEESLSDHFDHGSAKFKKEDKA